MDSDKDGKVSRAEFDAAHADKAGMFDEIDTDKDGFMDADEAKAHHEGRCGSDKKRSEEHTSELQSLMRISYAVFCLKKKNSQTKQQTHDTTPTSHISKNFFLYS